MKATRRFCARPASVSFEATGRFWPYPTALRRERATPLSARYAITASARSWLRLWFSSAEPSLSVWPSTRTLSDSYSLSVAATLSRIVIELPTISSVPVVNWTGSMSASSIASSAATTSSLGASTTRPER